MGLVVSPWRVYLDANVFIRFIESEGEDVAFLFESAAADAMTLFTSEFTISEVLVTPKRDSDVELERAYEELLIGDDLLEVAPVSREVLRKTAEIRACLGNKGPAAIHIATAELSRCDVLVSSDRRLKLPVSMTRVAIEHLRDLDAWP